MKHFLFCIFFSLIILVDLSFCQLKEITLFIRVDDIFMRESPIQPQEIDSFLKVAEKHNAHIMLATIPSRLLQSETNAFSKMSLQLIDYSKRGHQIVQHGFNHRCHITNSTSWEFYTPDISGYSKEQAMNIIIEGKHLLEAVIGKKITTYVGPGNDNDSVLSSDEKLFRNSGYIWLTDQSSNKPYIKDGFGYFFGLNDYAWALNDSIYTSNLEEAKSDFLKTAKQNNYWGILFHDHFTRVNYNGGITIRWFDEFLTWIKNDSGYNVRICTLDEWFSEQIKKSE